MDFPFTDRPRARSTDVPGTGTAPRASAPAGAQPPLVPIDAKALAPAKTLIRQALTAPEKEPLHGKPVSLRTSIELASGNRPHVNTVRAYWKLSFTIADYHFSVEEAEFLMNLPSPQSTHHQALLKSHQACAEARQAASRLAVLQAQQDLAGPVSAATDDDLPIASDVPFVGVYRTHFDELNSRGAAPDHLRHIDRALPVMHQLIHSRATAVFAAAEAVEELERAYEEGKVDLTAVTDSHERLRRQRREFLASVRNYNEQIARYAFSVAVPGLAPDRIVGMLIEQPHADTQLNRSVANGEIQSRSSQATTQ
jgi:hypothetical protein